MENGKWKTRRSSRGRKRRARIILHSPFSILHSRAFTLVEMLAVVGIIILLLAISVPGISRTWNERKFAQSVTLVRGLLMSTRAQALHAGERGLFFFVDPRTGAQRIAPIVADLPRDDDPNTPGYQEKDLATGTTFNPVTDAMTVNRFTLAEGDIYTLPIPIRVVPRDMVDVYGNSSAPFWPEGDIAWNDHSQPATPQPPGSLQFCRHRNFFALIFGPDGKLMVGRDVLIRDPDALPLIGASGGGDNEGDRTGLFVEEASKYFTNQVPATSPPDPPVDPTGGGGNLLDMIVETNPGTPPTGNDRALNFRSVDGLLVYDDSILRDIPEDTAASTPPGLGLDGKRGYLIREGLPIYVSRGTGEIIEGPRGER